MKLISCYITGFGKLRNVRLDFNPQITGICEANGYGKTTLAAFLKAMFYGMDPVKKNSKAFSDRAHYLPFDGGTYGGSVFFEYQGRRYKIERVFDSASDKKDTLRATCDRPGGVDFTDPVGEMLFGIDKASFERTIFITPQEIELSSTESIRNKLNNFVEGSNDDTSMQQAVARLTKRAKEYHKSNSSGLIETEKARESSIKAGIANRNTISAGLTSKYESLREMEKKIQEVSDQVTAAQTENVLREDWERYDSIMAEAARAKEDTDSILSRYPYGVPDHGECLQVQEAVSAIETEKAVQQKKTFTDEDARDYAAYLQEFRAGVPDNDSMAKVRSDVLRMRDAQARVSALQSAEISPDDAALAKRFGGRLPDEAALSALAENEARYKSLDEEYNSTPDMLEAPARPKANRTLNIIMLIIAAVLVVAGIGVCFAQLVAGIVLLVIGVAVAIIDCFLYLSRRAPAQPAASANPQKETCRQQREATANRIGAIIMPYGYSFESGVLFGISSFRKDLEKYMSFMEKETDRREKIRAKESERDGLSQSVTNYFRRFGLSGDPLECCSTLAADISKFQELKKRKNSSETSEKASADSIRANSAVIQSFCSRYGFPMQNIKETVLEIQDDLSALQRNDDAVRDATARANEFRARKKLGTRPAGGTVDISALNDRLCGLQEEKGKIALDIANAERDVEARDGLESDLETCQGRIKAYTANYSIILKTMDAIRAADDRLKDKYANPISESFARYGAALERTTGEKIYMTRDLNVRFEHAGMEKGEEYLSSGQRTACALCFRLAMLDNMYSDEKPFLILDDPFCSMDAVNFESSRDLLVDLSRDFQVVYFTCHESRMI